MTKEEREWAIKSFTDVKTNAEAVLRDLPLITELMSDEDVLNQLSRKSIEEQIRRANAALEALKAEVSENYVSRQTGLEHGCYNCGHVRLDKTCRVYCQLRAESGRCEAYNSWTPLPEPCEDCVSRQAVLDVWRTSYSDNREENEEIQYKKIAFELPPVTPQPKTGHWVDCGEREPWYRCSECGRRVWGGANQYCPDCGLKMIKPYESEVKK